VDENRLYRSGQMTPEGFRRVVREQGIRTVISLRDRVDESGEYEDGAEVEYCREHGIGFYRLPPADWTPVGGVIPGDENIKEFLRILDDPTTQRPVLIHCFAGIHRTGAHCAVYRIEYQNWSAADAIAEMRAVGTSRSTFADNLIQYLEAYTPRGRPELRLDQ
jgi:tyrosine-protein phosphatase SIW14